VKYVATAFQQNCTGQAGPGNVKVANLICFQDPVSQNYTYQSAFASGSDYQNLVANVTSYQTASSNTGLQSATCSPTIDYMRKLTSAAKTSFSFVLEAVCSTGFSGTASCWSSFFPYIQALPVLTLPTAAQARAALGSVSADVLASSNCNNGGCKVLAAGIVAAYGSTLSTLTSTENNFYGAVSRVARYACVADPGNNNSTCNARPELSNIVSQAQTSVLNIYSTTTRAATTTSTPAAGAATTTTTSRATTTSTVASGSASTTTSTVASASTTTSTVASASTTTSTVASASTTSTTTVADTTTSTTTEAGSSSAAARRALQASSTSTVAASTTSTVAASTTTSTVASSAATVSTTTASGFNPTAAYSPSIYQQQTQTAACAFLTQFLSSTGCCGSNTGPSIINDFAAIVNPGSLPSNWTAGAFQQAAAACKLTLDPFCNSGGKGGALTQVSVTFSVAGVNCAVASNKFIGTFGYGLLQSFVNQGFAALVSSTDATLCGKSVQATYSANLGFSRRLQSATPVTLTATGSSAQLAKLSAASTSTGSAQTTALANLNQAIAAALTDAVAYTATNAASDLAAAVPNAAALSATPVTASALSVTSVTQAPVGQALTTVAPVAPKPNTPSAAMSSAYLGFSAVVAAFLAFFLA